MSEKRSDSRLTTLGLRWLLFFWSSIAVLFYLAGCSTDKYEHLPQEIQQFIDRYYPGLSVASYSESAGVFTVNLDNSATLVFNPDLRWTSIEGNGNTLPHQLLFDDFPTPLYDYIVTTDNLASVYAVSRLAGIYTVTFHDYTISYNIASEEITPVTDPK